MKNLVPRHVISLVRGCTNALLIQLLTIGLLIAGETNGKSAKTDQRMDAESFEDSKFENGLSLKEIPSGLHFDFSNSEMAELPLNPENLESPWADIEVSGTVTDANGTPIPGATISVPGSAIGTATDLDGKYALSVPEGATLIFPLLDLNHKGLW